MQRLIPVADKRLQLSFSHLCTRGVHQHPRATLHQHQSPPQSQGTRETGAAYSVLERIFPLKNPSSPPESESVKSESSSSLLESVESEPEEPEVSERVSEEEDMLSGAKREASSLRVEYRSKAKLIYPPPR